MGETISGIVVDTAGNPVADAEIVFRGASTYLNAQTAANGWFKAGGFPVTDEVMLFASKGKDIHTSVRTEPDGTTKALAAGPRSATLAKSPDRWLCPKTACITSGWCFGTEQVFPEPCPIISVNRSPK